MKLQIFSVLPLALASLSAGAQDSLGLKVKLTGNGAEMESVTFSGHRKWLAASGWDNKIVIYQSDTPKIWTVNRTLEGHYSAVTSLRCSKDNKWLVSGSKDNTARLWDMETGKQKLLVMHGGPVVNAFIDPSGKSLISGSNDGIIKVTDPLGVIKTKTIKTGLQLNDLLLGPDKKSFYLAAASASLIKTDLLGKQILKLDGHKDHILSLDLSPDGKMIVSGSADKTAIVWELATGKPKYILNGHSWKVTSVNFSSDGKYVVTGSSDGITRIYSMETGKLTGQVNAFGSDVRRAVFNPEMNMLAVATTMEGSLNGPLVYNTGLKREIPLPKTAAKGTAAGAKTGAKTTTKTGTTSTVKKP